MEGKAPWRPNIPPTAGVIIMVALTIILAAVIAAFTFGMTGNVPFIKIEKINEEHLKITATNGSNGQPVPNVEVAIYAHKYLVAALEGPTFTNESGIAILRIPEGYKSHFDVIGKYQGITTTETIDNRNLSVKWSEELGPLGVSAITTVMGFALGFLLGKRKVE
jgi:hypothetical protein